MPKSRVKRKGASDKRRLQIDNDNRFMNNLLKRAYEQKKKQEEIENLKARILEEGWNMTSSTDINDIKSEEE